ncbi:alpha/beta hydrolase [Clostridium saccharobutylicum]|uniref:Acetyl esterase n=1 Tax=Clostridium saccharobutylicum TaxID=169679 RepID=A0A1S8MT58_CLOSA|nr:alpha/beta hydrolase [Clostridium saccharobutylicum]OOM07360.1 acetyl esterase [Clostridium saccharobutylicum]
MKKFFKKLFLILFLVIMIFILIFHKRLLLCYGIAEKYISLQKNISSTKDLDIRVASNSMDYKNIVYKNTNGVPLTLDIYGPSKNIYKSSPVIVYVHGGSWAYGDKTIPDALSPVLDTFRSEGYTIISTSYELMRNKENFNKQICDVKDTIRWIYKNQSNYNLDTNEIGVLGVSSGAHLSLMAGYSNDKDFADDPDLTAYSSKVKYLIDFSGPTDLGLLNTSNLNADLSRIFSSITNKSKIIDKFNPINYINSNTPKTLIIHSKADSIVPYKSSEELYSKCNESGVKAQLISLDSSAHDLSDISSDDIISMSKGLLSFIVLNSPL